MYPLVRLTKIIKLDHGQVRAFQPTSTSPSQRETEVKKVAITLE